MARITVYENQVERQGVTGARFVAGDFGGSGIGQGLQIAGRTLSNFAEEQQQLNDIHDQATVKEAANGVGSYFAQLGYTGDNPYFTKTGKDALVERPEIEKSLDTYIQNAERGLKTERQREMFRNVVTAQRTAWGVQIAQHADRETRSYDIDQTTARIGVSGEIAKSTYLADPKHGEDQIDTGLGEIDNLAQLQGWSPERRQLEKLKFTSGTYRDIAVSIITADPTNGPAVVEKLVEARGGAMTADDREFILNNAQTQVRMNEAEARRQEAEQRRIQREAANDAKDRARSAAENLDLGIPMDATTYAKAVEDAKASGDENLLKRVQTGQFKNLLSREYAGATPNELQTRVNELTAQIQREGEKAKPETVIERDHLTTLLGKANAAMSQDSLSYGAANSGITLGPLDLNDPASVRQRADIARKVGKRMGGVVRVMTNEEAATFAPMVVNGSIKERAMLAVRLARFGDLADEAARQVAPNNASFQNLVGLAGHPSANVGFSRVTEVLAGKEIMEKSPGLIDQKAAIRTFDAQTGQAFRFLPSVRSGVIENAYGILAYDANKRGARDWAQAQGDRGARWYTAFNSALGAYTKDGKQYGGLTNFNGGVTIVPDDMSVPDFEARIARATAAQLKKAHNGQPEYSSGKIPTASELKKMQWVPVSDGIYRLSNGSAFLMKTGGGFYEIDIRKVK